MDTVTGYIGQHSVIHQILNTSQVGGKQPRSLLVPPAHGVSGIAPIYTSLVCAIALPDRRIQVSPRISNGVPSPTSVSLPTSKSSKVDERHASRKVALNPSTRTKEMRKAHIGISRRIILTSRAT